MSVVCPVCGCDPITEECGHLAFHGDDLRTRDVVLESSGEEVFGKLEGEVPQFASDFFDQFGEHFPAFVSCELVGWEGVPGCSGVYAYIWAKSRVSLLNQIDRFLSGRV